MREVIRATPRGYNAAVTGIALIVVGGGTAWTLLHQFEAVAPVAVETPEWAAGLVVKPRKFDLCRVMFNDGSGGNYMPDSDVSKDVKRVPNQPGECALQGPEKVICVWDAAGALKACYK